MRRFRMTGEMLNKRRIWLGVKPMRVFWEKLGVLGPIYRLVGEGLNDRDIANKLNLTEAQVQGCISWMLHFFKMNGRIELAREAFATEHPPLNGTVERQDEMELDRAFELAVVSSGNDEKDSEEGVGRR